MTIKHSNFNENVQGILSLINDSSRTRLGNFNA